MSKDSENPLYVTRPHLPPLEELLPYLEEIWRTRMLSNAGPIHQRLEHALAEFLRVEHISLVANATLGLELALRARQLRGEVITTPFTFVGTAHAISQAGLEPVFVDIEPETLALDPRLVEAKINERTCAILPVHCFGYGCDTAALGDIARRHRLPLVYDAAHAFGIDDGGGSILRHGDASVLSFHATKVFTTFEGGAVISSSAEEKEIIDRLRNFGLRGDSAELVGTNAKMNEFNAAVGLVLLRHVRAAIVERERRDALYRALLADVPGIVALRFPEKQSRNYYSFPILVEKGFPLSRDEVYEAMHARGVIARRYFHPLVTDMPAYRDGHSRGDYPIARDVASRILCLPLHPELTPDEQERVVAVLRGG